MFELLFAWAVFTAVLGKSAEAVTHAWKGTAPPSHLRKMARIRAAEAKRLGEGERPAGPARTWARTVWGDSWEAATERHRERWPAKAAKKARYARQRWDWWDHVEEESGRRWDERWRERDQPADRPVDRRQAVDDDDVDSGGDKAPTPDPRGPDADTPRAGKGDPRPRSEPDRPSRPRRRRRRAVDEDDDTGEYPPKSWGEPRYMAWENPDTFGRKVPWAELTDAERELWYLKNERDPRERPEIAARRRELEAWLYRVRDQAWGPPETWTDEERPRASTPPPTGGEGPSPTPPDTPDSAKETPGQAPDEGVRGPGHPGQGPVSGSTTQPTPAADASGATPTGNGAAPMAEVINLQGATRLSSALVRQSTAALAEVEQIVAWLDEDRNVAGTVHSTAATSVITLTDRFREISVAAEAFKAQAQITLNSCKEQARVRDAVAAAGGSALSKEALTGRTS